MKKTVSFLLLSCGVMFASAQTDSIPAPQKPAQQDALITDEYRSTGKNFYKDFSRWSLSIEGGLNAFDGDVYQYRDKFFQSIRGAFSAGLTVEYTFNPIVSLGLENYYLPVRVNSQYHYLSYHPSSTKYQVVESDHFQSALFLSVNLLRMFNKNTHTHWGVWANLGLGVAYFNSDYTQWNKRQRRLEEEKEWYKTVVTTADENYPNAIVLSNSYNVKNAWAVIVPVGVNIEYNFTKNFAAGIKVNYTSYNRDDLEGSKYKQDNVANLEGDDVVSPDGKLNASATRGLNYAGVTNDFISSAFINLRWKFTKNKPHTRNITWKEFEPDQGEEAKKLAQKALDKIDKLKPPKDYDDAIADLQDQIDDLRDDVDKLKNFLCVDGPDSDGDGVPDCRDLENNTPPNTPVDFYGRGTTAEYLNEVPAVFFDFDKYYLDDLAQQEVYKAAKIMKANPNLLCEVRAYCDVVGTDKYNQQLSINRANRVKNELVKVYGISPDRIVANGNGRILEPNHRYRINRRAEFHFSE